MQAITEFKAAIDTEDLEEARVNLSLVSASPENVDATELHAAPIGVPFPVSAVWCEIVD